MIPALAGAIMLIWAAGICLLWKAEYDWWEWSRVTPPSWSVGTMPTVQIHDTIGLV